jgi:hypothetical protein
VIHDRAASALDPAIGHRLSYPLAQIFDRPRHVPGRSGGQERPQSGNKLHQIIATDSTRACASSIVNTACSAETISRFMVYSSTDSKFEFPSAVAAEIASAEITWAVAGTHSS